MSEQAAARRTDFRTVLGEQQRRVVAALTEAEPTDAEPIDAEPILREDESLSWEEYVTAVYELHHVHLPELEAAGVIEFDKLEETVRRGTNFDESRQLCDHGHDR